jgi:hypothetical protein
MQRLALAALAIALATPAAAQQPASTTPITIGTVPCGRTGGPSFNCYSVPITVGDASSTAWFFPQGNGGFILFRPPTEGDAYVTARVTSTTVNSRNTIGQVTQETITYTVVGDPDGDGDSDTVVGSVTINMTYAYSRGGGGKGGGGAGWYMTITGGTGAQSITQD